MMNLMFSLSGQQKKTKKKIKENKRKDKKTFINIKWYKVKHSHFPN